MKLPVKLLNDAYIQVKLLRLKITPLNFLNDLSSNFSFFPIGFNLFPSIIPEIVVPEKINVLFELRLTLFKKASTNSDDIRLFSSKFAMMD